MLAASFQSNRRLGALVEELESLSGRLSGDAITNVLNRTALNFDDVAAFIKPSPTSYCRQRVARAERYEILLITWLPGQATGAHDHAGSVSAFRILCGTARETTYAQSADSLVDPVATRELIAGDVGIDGGDVIHAVRNDATGNVPVVSLHVYAPPMPELRRFTIRQPGCYRGGAFERRRPPCAAGVVAIIGGGFSGSMVAAQLARQTAVASRPLHVVMVDRQPSIAEGAAYRTCDSGHLLNVPASAMSAWPDRPDDLLDWARTRDPAIGPNTFLERRVYGEYLRDTLFNAAHAADPETSLEIRREEAYRIERRTGGGWRVHLGASPPLDADAVVLATGHRAVADPLKRCWTGTRTRYIEEPWGSVALSSIDPTESVCLLGSGLTAIDVLRSLAIPARTAPVVALSRRGLLPAVQAAAQLPPLDPRSWLEPLLEAPNGLSIRPLTRAIRQSIWSAATAGIDWRQIIDGLRPHISRVWKALPAVEVDRFLRHARPFWEVARHRMAPSIAAVVTDARDTDIFRTTAARIDAAHGTLEGVTLTVRRRGGAAAEKLRFDWVVNCTGPATGRGEGLPALIADLINSGHLEEDSRGLGVRSSPAGHAAVDGRIIDDLLVVGSLRKPDLWECTAVPELRLQAALAAAVLTPKGSASSPSGQPPDLPNGSLPGLALPACS